MASQISASLCSVNLFFCKFHPLYLLRGCDYEASASTELRHFLLHQSPSLVPTLSPKSLAFLLPHQSPPSPDRTRTNALRKHRIFKIHRSQNLTAHSLATQARASQFVCSKPHHRGSCPVLDSLRPIICETITLLSVKCS